MWEIIPKPGRIRISTAGGPPPPAGSKKVVFRFRSVRSIVMPAARTGRDRRSSTAVIRTDHTNRGV